MPRNTASLNIDIDLHKQLKIKAAEEGKKLSTLSEGLLRAGLKRLEEEKRLVK